MPSILVVDIGTSSLKGAVISSKGEVLSYGRQVLPTERTVYPESWENALVNLLQEPEFLTVDFEALVIGGNAPTLVPLLKNKTQLPAIMWYEEDLPLFKNKQCSSYYLPQAAFFRDKFPDQWNDLSGFLGCPEYLAWKLTGIRSFFTPYNAFNYLIWDSNQLEAYNLDRNLFPDFIISGQRVGLVTSSASRRTGLKEGLPVLAGATDYHCSLLGSNTISPGQICDRAGTSEGLNLCIPKEENYKGLRTTPHVIEGYYNLSCVLPFTGRVFEEYRYLSGQNNVPYSAMIENALHAKQKVKSFLYHPLSGFEDITEFRERCRLVLVKNQDLVAITRNLLESICFAVKEGFDSLEKHGIPFDSVTVSGGQARTDLFNQLKADITGKKIVIPRIVDTELAGLAALGFVGIGEFSCLKDSSKALFFANKEFSPDQALVEEYNYNYIKYKKPFC